MKRKESSWLQPGEYVNIAHYAHHAQKIEPEVVALAEYLTARSTREVLQEAYGYSKEPEQVLISSELLNNLNQAMQQIKAIAEEHNYLMSRASIEHPGLLNIMQQICKPTERLALPASDILGTYSANDYLALRGVKLTKSAKFAFYGQIASNIRAFTHESPRKIAIAPTHKVNAYRLCDFPILDNALQSVLKQFN